MTGGWRCLVSPYVAGTSDGIWETIVATDPDGDVLRYEWYSDPDGFGGYADYYGGYFGLLNASVGDVELHCIVSDGKDVAR